MDFYDDLLRDGIYNPNVSLSMWRPANSAKSRDS